MNLCIIAAKEDEDARYLYEEFKKKGFSKLFLADLAKLNVRVSGKKLSVRYKTELNWDAYFIRPAGEYFPFSYLVASILEEQAPVLPPASTILNCYDRGLLAKTIFDSKTLFQPLTYISSSADAAEKTAIKFKKLALKFVKHGGKGVAILEKPSTASELLDIFSDLAQPFFIQRFVEGEIIKALIVGEEVIAFKEHVPIKEEKSQEGKKEYIKLEEELKSTLIKLAKYLKAPLFEIDLIKHGRRYFAIDVGLNPGLKMRAELSGKNVGAIFADYILRNYSTTQTPLDL